MGWPFLLLRSQSTSVLLLLPLLLHPRRNVNAWMGIAWISKPPFWLPLAMPQGLTQDKRDRMSLSHQLSKHIHFHFHYPTKSSDVHTSIDDFSLKLCHHPVLLRVFFAQIEIDMRFPCYCFFASNSDIDITSAPPSLNVPITHPPISSKALHIGQLLVVVMPR